MQYAACIEQGGFEKTLRDRALRGTGIPQDWGDLQESDTGSSDESSSV